MRQILDSRPLFLAAIALCLGACLHRSPLCLLLVAVLLVVLSTWQMRFLAVLATVVGVFLAPAGLQNPPPEFRGIGQVSTVPAVSRFGGAWTILQTNSGQFLLPLKSETGLSLGDQIQISGELSPFTGPTGERWLQRGVLAKFKTRHLWLKRVGEGPWLYRVGLKWRTSFRQFTREGLSPDDASVLDALCFNVDAALDPDIKDDLRRAGTIHIISASGLHLLLFCWGCQWLLSRFPVPRPLQLFFLSVLLLIYGGAAGLRPPIFRSVIMTWMQLWAYTFEREYDALTAVGFSGILQVLMMPLVVFDPSFQLSYGIVCGLCLFPMYSASKGILGRIWSDVRTSFVASATGAPMLAYYFGQISLVSVLSNLLVSPVLGVLIGSSLVGWLVWLGWPDAGVMILDVPVLLSHWIQNVSHLMGGLPGAVVPTPGFSAYAVWIAVVAILLLVRFRRRPSP